MVEELVFPGLNYTEVKLVTCPQVIYYILS